MDANIKLGKLVVFTGRTGSGKDFLADRFLSHEFVKIQGFSRIVTNASRNPRPGEIHGQDYWFETEEKIFEMHKMGQLVEAPFRHGTTFKATSKSEVLSIISGENKIWRIDLSLAAKVASGEFFDTLFPKNTADKLKNNTVVIFVEVDSKTLVRRREQRDGDKYDPKEYLERDLQELEILKFHGHHFKQRISNPDGEIDKTLEKLIKIIQEIL